MKRVLLLFTVLIGLGLIAAPAFAQVLDPQIYVCQSCTAAAGGDPNLITNTGSFRMGWNGSGSNAGPLLIIIGVFNSTTAPTVTIGSTTLSPSGAAIYGWNGTQGATMNFNTSPGGGGADPYQVLGFSPEDGGSSESFNNWEAALAPNGIPSHPSTDFYTLYVYEFASATLPPSNSGTSLAISESGAPKGSYILGYACEVTGTPCPSGKEGATPFTNAGLVDAPPVPEPASMFLMGTLLSLFGGFLGKKKLTS